MTPLIVLAAMVAASPVDTTYITDHNGLWKAWTRPDGAECTSGPEPIGDVLCAITPTEPDTIGYWLNRRMDYNWCNSCSPRNEYGIVMCTAPACAGREVIDTVWVIRKH